MNESKQFKTYGEQLDLLRARGMQIGDPAEAETILARLSYYRLSGYWYPMRRFDASGAACDEFQTGASFDLVMDLYMFDERLRSSVFIELSQIELAIRAMLGHELGRIDPFLYLDERKLGADARNRVKGGRTKHSVWVSKYRLALESSREDFVAHYQEHYGGALPIWVAVEVMDWGMLSYLYGMAPCPARVRVAEKCALSAPQLASWLRSLNTVRNHAAHHARMFNRVYDIKPKLGEDPRLAPVAGVMNRVFGQLTLIQYLHRQLNLSPAKKLPELLGSFPSNRMVPFGRTGAPDGWRSLEFWSS